MKKPEMQGLSGIPAQDRELLETAVEAARRAAEVHTGAAPGGRLAAAVDKGRADFVTEVDREAERRVVESLLGRFPDHAVVAEEGTRSGGSAPGAVRWIVDPLDGTTNWLHGYPEYAVSLAAADDEGLRVAVVLNTATDELYRAVRGVGAWRDDGPIRVSETDDLELALVGTGFPFKKEGIVEPYLEVLGRVLRSTSGVRRAGSAALDLCHLASGRLDAFFEMWLMPWDVAAGALVVREAGGRFAPLELDWVREGEPVDPRLPELRPGAFLGSNRVLEERFSALIRGP